MGKRRVESTGICEEVTVWAYCYACKREVPNDGSHERTIDHQLNTLYEFRKSLLSRTHTEKTMQEANRATTQAAPSEALLKGLKDKRYAERM